MPNNRYISFVVAARNDDYGSGFINRLQVSLNILLTLCKNYSLDMELIIVEWNPIEDATNLAGSLTWPEISPFQEIRFIKVPNVIHRRLPYSDKMPFFEFIAKNVGIRRAKGEYVVPINADVIFNRELIEFLALRQLSSAYFYRINTHDVEKMIPVGVSIEEQLEFCEKYWVRANTVKGVSRRSLPFLDYRYLWSFTKWLGGKLISHPRAGIHTNKSGDFFLMHQNHWHSLRGYPEIPTNVTTDGYMCFMAASSGLSQSILGDKKRLYHQEHSRLRQCPRHLVDFQLYLQRGKQMMKLKQPLTMNDKNWGLGQENLPEYGIFPE